MTQDRKRKRQTREIMTEFNLPYTHAARLLWTVLEADPTLAHNELRDRCNELLEMERGNAKRD